ncbi:Wzz/FepE/Etk N-terminal domain-containing protein [Thalassotalea sp. PLHSN55]|uniref:Wzz/FepE/Etk N-terminal domain-containing protein n=1 Tax=Thalassotalea sp. PLHSN55 TaxID=3435888 RepID=UPI003F877ACB
MENNSNQGVNTSQQQYITIPANSLFPQQQNNDDEIDLAELWRAIWAGKLTIIAITFIFAVASVIYAISQPNIYKASTVLAPASSDGGAGGLSALAGQFGGLASMAGINLGGGSTDKTGLALEVLKSRAFLEKFINKHKLLLPLMAVESWDIHNDKLIFDKDIYNEQTHEWVRDVTFPKTPKPSAWETFEALKEILSVATDKESGMISLSIEYYSPELAKQWLILLVKDLNKEMREKDKKEAQESINFLTNKLEQTQLADMQTVFYQLIEEQTKTMMLTEVSEEYVLKTIDPANAPDEEAKPKRGLICVLGTMLGGILAVLIVLIRYFTNSSRSTKPNESIQTETPRI